MGSGMRIQWKRTAWESSCLGFIRNSYLWLKQCLICTYSWWSHWKNEKIDATLQFTVMLQKLKSRTSSEAFLASVHFPDVGIFVSHRDTKSWLPKKVGHRLIDVGGGSEGRQRSLESIDIQNHWGGGSFLPLFPWESVCADLVSRTLQFKLHCMVTKDSVLYSNSLNMVHQACLITGCSPRNHCQVCSLMKAEFLGVTNMLYEEIVNWSTHPCHRKDGTAGNSALASKWEKHEIGSLTSDFPLISIYPLSK